MKPKRVENYELYEVIGQGRFGQVYRSINIETKEQVAVKVVPQNKFVQNPTLYKTTMHQIKALSAIKGGENIVKYIEFLSSTNNNYFVYEFCNGGTLEKAIKTSGKFSEPKALLYFKQLLSAFRVLNKHNIIHRDLKPDNIYFHDGIIKVGDFGFCKAMDSNEELAKTMLGSPLYMAPEVLKNQIYTNKVDIWSLGVVLYQMLFGFCPFESNNMYDLIINIKNNEIKIPANNITWQTESLLRKMLVKDQFRRVDWNILLNINISEDGRIVPADITASMERLTINPVNSVSQLRVSKNIQPIVKSVKSSDSSSLNKLTTEGNNAITKKKFLEEHERCMKAVVIAGNFIREMDKLGLPFAFIILREIESRLQWLSHHDITLKTKDQLAQVRRNLADIDKELSSYDRQLLKTPKNFMKYRFMGERDGQLTLWMQMVVFLKGDTQQPMFRQEMVTLVKQFLA